MKNKKVITLTLIGLFIFLFSIIGLTYAYWQITRTQTDENLVYTDCLKLTTTLTDEGAFTLTDAYPMKNDELVSDFFPNQAPYHFTITNECESDIPISINMESLTPTNTPYLSDEYVDIILWEGNEEEHMIQDETQVLSRIGSRVEIGSTEEKPSYKLTDHKINQDKIIAEANTAYQIYKFTLPGKQEGRTDNTKEFNLLLFMDYATPVSTTENQTNNAHWAGKITLNNYELPKVNIGGINVQTVEEGDGLYAVEHIKNEENPIEDGFYNTEYRYAGANPDNYVWFNCQDGYTSGEDTCEKWRIIGLVNVKTESGNIEQRLKIIRDQSLGRYSWDHKPSGTGSATTIYGSNDWTDSQLMEMLNDNYYNSNNNPCYQGSSSTVTCDFSPGLDPKGLSATARNMIDKEIIWNIGGWSNYSIKTSTVYEYERGTSKSSGRQITWSSSNTKKPATEVGKESTSNPTLFHSVGLMYPSDYGYAVGGENRSCIENKQLFNSNGDDYRTCILSNWLYLNSGEWLLSSSAAYGFGTFRVGLVGNVSDNYTYGADDVRPVVYLSSFVSITGSTEDSENPVGSETNPFILTME